MTHDQHVLLEDIKAFTVANGHDVKKVALFVGAICDLIMVAAFAFLETIFADPFERNPWLPGAFEAWCLAQCFGKVAEFFKREAEENLSLMHSLA